jgi:hypothetical protein
VAKGGVIGTIASVVVSPVTAPLAIAEAVAPKAVDSVETKAQGVPVVGTLVNGAQGAANIGPDLISGGAVGKDVGAVGKAGLVVGGAYVGGVAGAYVGNMVGANGVSPSGLLNLAGDYFGGQDFSPEDLLNLAKAAPTPSKSGGGSPALPGKNGAPPPLPRSGEQTSPLVALALLGTIAIIGRRI